MNAPANAPVTDLSTTEPTAAVDQHLAREIDRWLTAAPRSLADGLPLARLVTCQVRRYGRHMLNGPLLAALREIQLRHRGRDPYLDAFLDSILARQQNRFRNQTYLALPLLELILADPQSGLDPERMSALLIADIVRHENQTADSGQVDSATRTKRVRHATRFVADVDDVGQAPGPARESDLPTLPATAACEWFALTVLPVSVVHDEYFFIRALQAHEMVFTTLAGELRKATAATRAGRINMATTRVNGADVVFQRAAMLFRLVATMRAEAFHDFRQFTEGASAIQSEAYKRFEIACGHPSLSRLQSDAFMNVPMVQAEAYRQDNLTRAYGDLRRRGVEESACLRLDAAISRLEASHQKWKTTHHGLAAKMLGDAHGSGYTAGVPYLKGCLENRLFTSDAAAFGCQRAAS